MMFKKFIKAVSSNNIENVKLLLADKRIDPSGSKNYAIRYASVHGYIEVVKLLLADERVDPSAKNNHAILYTSMRGYTEIVKLLLADSRVDASKVDVEKLKKFQSRSNEIIPLLNSSLRKNKIRNFL